MEARTHSQEITDCDGYPLLFKSGEVNNYGRPSALRFWHNRRDGRLEGWESHFVNIAGTIFCNAKPIEMILTDTHRVELHID
jgi:hypothetical protein